MNIYEQIKEISKIRKSVVEANYRESKKGRAEQLKKERAEIEEIARAWNEDNMREYMIREYNWSSSDDPDDSFSEMTKLKAACIEIGCKYSSLLGRVHSGKSNVPLLKLKPKKERAQFYMHKAHIELLKENFNKNIEEWYIV